MKSRKMVLINLSAGQQWRCRHGVQTYEQGLVGRKERVKWRGWDEWREQNGNTHVTICKIRQPVEMCCMM